MDRGQQLAVPLETSKFTEATMTETSRLLEAAAALSQVLTANAIPHAFHGSLLVSMLSKNPQCNVGVAIRYHVVFLTLV